MGCLVLNSFLCLNPDIAERLAGVMYSGPLFGIPDFKQLDPVKIEVLKLLSLAIDEFVINMEIPLHKVTRNRNQHLSVLQTQKGAPLASLGFMVSVIRMQDLVHAKAKSTTYPYLLVLGDKDIIVNNRVSREWHAKTSSKVKKIKLMMGAYHELTKEPNNHVIFEASLLFMGERLVGKAPGTPAKPFG